MRYIFYIFFTLLGIKSYAQVNDFFSFEASLRIDFYLIGDAKNEKVVFSQLKKEPFWGGSTTKLIHPNYGEFRLQLIDNQKNTILFSKGFNSLLSEWQHVENAQNETQLFQHAIQVPFPKKITKLIIEKRNKNGLFYKIAEKTLNPSDYFIKSESVASFPVKNLLKNGKSSQKVDLVILAEGYSQNEIEKFYADAQRMTDYMFRIPPFDKLKKDFNVYAIGVTSSESGTDIPGKNIFKRTIFNSSFYTFDMERYLTTNDMFAIADVASLVPYDQIYILVNSSIYGGGGFYNHLNLTTADHPLSEKVFIHEFGHGFVGLADEYYSSETAFDSLYNKSVEPWEANITTLVNFDQKWKNMIKKSTPIPTPRNEKFRNEIGVFEGGGYSAKGIYSPVQDCRMKSNQPEGFCPVCERTIETIVKLYTE